jgi:transposase
MVAGLFAVPVSLSVSSLYLAEQSACKTRARGERFKAWRELRMSKRQKGPLRELTQQEEHALQKLAKASSERMDVIKRAKALLAVTAGTSYTEAAKQAGYKSNDTVSRLVSRFNQRGLLALSIAVGRGRKPTYTSQEHAHILAEVQRKPDHQEDQTGVWSLMTLRQALRKTDLPHIGAETIRQVLHESGYSYQRTRTWCRTGYALRTRKSGTVMVYDPETPGKKINRTGLRAGRGRRDYATQ